MRPTQATTYRTLQYQTSRMGIRLQDLRTIAATGKKVNRPSDEPTSIKSILHTRSQIRANDRFIETMDIAVDRISSMESFMDHMEHLMASAKEVGVASINAALNDRDLEIMGDQMANLKEELLATANAQVDGKYIFAGYAEKTKPFVVNGAYTPAAYDPANSATWPVLYNGDGNTSNVEISPGEKINVGINGAALFMGDADNDGAVDSGASNIFAALTRMEEAIRTGDTQAITAELTELDNGADQSRRLRGRLGNNAVRIENSKRNIEESQIDLEQVLSRYQDADLVEVISNITQQETAFKAALNITARTTELSIFDYL